MRIRTGLKFLALGLGLGAVLGYWSRRASRDASARRVADFPVDLEDPVQDFDEEVITGSEDVYDRESNLVRPGDAGDLYGMHTPVAVDRVHPDDDRAFEDGQNWLEALETSAIENGVDPERPLDDIVDDADLLRTPHPSLRRDIPVADLGSGGRRGL